MIIWHTNSYIAELFLLYLSSFEAYIANAIPRIKWQKKKILFLIHIFLIELFD